MSAQERTLGSDGAGSPEATERMGTRDGRAGADVEALPQRGQLLGRYVVLERIGAGAIGLVYSAYDPDLDRRVALKLLLRRSENDDARMTREAQAVAKIVHPNVVAVHDVGLWRDRVFVAMELVEGTNLAGWARQQPRSVAETVAVFLQAARGLAAAHAAGIIHRDFKPENALIGHDGRVRVADFGLARAAEDTAAELEPVALSRSGALQLQLTATGALVGTPAYMAPEQHARAPCSAASDQFSFCIALWEALYGERPFAGETVAALALNVLDGRVAPPPRSRAVPAAIREALLRGLAVEPSSRFPSMDALIAALERAVRRRGRGLAVVLVGAGSLAGFAVAQGWSARHTQQCDPAASPVLTDWNPQARGVLEDAAAATGAPWATPAVGRIAGRFDAFARAWTEQWVELCRAEQAETTAARPELERRLECLDDRRRELVAALELLVVADAGTAEEMLTVAGGVRDVAACADDQVLRVRSSPPPKELLVEVGQIRDALAHAGALHRAGDDASARSMLESLRTRAAAVGWRHIELELEAEALSWMSAAEVGLDAMPQLRGLYDAALELDDPGLACRFALEIGWQFGYGRREFDEGLAWTATGEALRRRAGGDWLLGVVSRNNAAVIHSLEGEHDRAGELFHEAIVLAEQNDPLGLRPLQLRANLGSYYANLGDNERARTELANALEGYREAYGGQHPRVGDIEGNLGTVLVRMGDLDGAMVHLEASLALIEALPQAQRTTQMQILGGIAEVLEARGDLAGAAARVRRAVVMSEDRAGPASQLALMRAWLVRLQSQGPSPDRASIEAELAAIAADPAVIASPRLRGVTTSAQAEFALRLLPPAQQRAAELALLDAVGNAEAWLSHQLGQGHAQLVEFALARGDTTTAAQRLAAAEAVDWQRAHDVWGEAEVLLRLARAQAQVDAAAPRLQRWLELATRRAEALRGDGGRVRAEIERLRRVQ